MKARTWTGLKRLRLIVSIVFGVVIMLQAIPLAYEQFPDTAWVPIATVSIIVAGAFLLAFGILTAIYFIIRGFSPIEKPDKA